MKVLKGPETPKWKIEKKCVECTSVLEIEFSDLKHMPAEGDGPYYSPAYYSCQCPVCHDYIRIEEDKVPKAAKYKYTPPLPPYSRD